MICYDKAYANGTKDMILKGSCYESCKNIKYSFKLLKNSPGIWNNGEYGEDFTSYLFKPERLYPYMESSIPYKENFVSHRLQRISIIYINFEESKVLTVTKDAKITLPDMIGNIGGTLGVFIGFSFFGLLDTFIEWAQYLQEKIKSLRRPKSSLPS